VSSRQSRLAMLVALIAVLVLPLLVLGAAFRFHNRSGRTGAAYLCRAHYERARTAADTARVDMTAYPNGKFGPKLPCGMLRRRGDLQP